ncbi:hypothetical protein C8A05DRAFT_40755 [Staphylotrichum tortipilum]|uniref:SH3 domain-containing protein n=1 Tax=Staphylotrichum tortipilum TaxID=2831512 RepID=A0AAN6RXG9_9PEZI|nr:hypothetical protein C8A05DRAFT_40755 [Staphylotrichum longicolle]
MVLAPPPLPTRFPCWVRAVYSWGGESKRDLGFIEGDLIECLNAGDGSWWTGRLFRDRRAVGVFPSNFVEVLPDNFRPTTRSVSPLPNSNTPSPRGTPQKSKTFRKPFEAYAKAPHYTTAKIPETWKNGVKPQDAVETVKASPSRSREPSTNSFDHAGTSPSADLGRGPSPLRAPSHVARDPSPSRAPSHLVRDPSPSRAPSHVARDASPTRAPSFIARDTSPAQMQHYGREHSPAHIPNYGSRDASPASQMPSYAPRDVSPSRSPSHLARDASPSRAPSFDSRAPSPAPSYRPYRPPQSRQHAYHLSLETVDTYRPAPHRGDSPPPPPPPPHRSKLARHGPNASYDEGYYGGLSREPSALSRERSDPSYGYQSHQPQPSASYEPPETGYHTPRMPSPCPPSPGGLTPSPLREAMDDVMEQLDALGAGRETELPEPELDPWSPESFDMVHHLSRKKQQRPLTATGIPLHSDEGYETFSGSAESSQEPTSQDHHQEQPPPQLSNYVERMESRLRTMHQHNASVAGAGEDAPPPPPKRGHLFERPKSSMDIHGQPEQKIRPKKSAYEISRQALNRTFTTKTNSTNSSSATQSTDRSLMSGVSAGGISATSAGSMARKNRSRAQSALGMRDLDLDRPETPFTGITYHSSHASGEQRSRSQMGFHEDAMPAVGGLVLPKPKKQNFIKRILESAKTGVASTRGSIATASSSQSPSGRSTPAMQSLAGPLCSKPGREPGREMGLGGGVDWVQVRRDVNRSNSLSQNELLERRERCQMLDYPALDPVDELYNSIDGDEGADGMPVAEPVNFNAINLSQVDKNSRFLANLPPSTTPITLATTYVCRPYRSDVQRLRSIFTWVAEKIAWEEDFDGQIDTRRVLQTKRACAEEYATLVLEMCAAVGLTCEIVRGYLKTPGEIPEVNIMPRSNHWWNAVLVDDEWRIMDCCLASASNPRRILYSSYNNSSADPWWFLARPSEICWTHIPEHHEQQHMCPPVAHEVLLNLPCACPPYFKNGLEMVDYNTSLTRIEDLEMVHVKFSVPFDVEVAAEVEVRSYSRDADGDCFESGDTLRKRALAQAEWFGGVKRYTIKALLPGDEGTGVLKVYAGKRGLMHSIKDIPHPLAFALPIIHTGENPAYEFVTRHPTPHAQRHDIYVVQPQCQRLALNNTFVFAIRQHPSSVGGAGVLGVPPPSANPGSASPIPFARPSSAMSMTSSAAGSNPSTVAGGAAGGAGGSSGGNASKKPAKLAIQTPGGKILRLMRKEERRGIGGVLGGGGRGPASPAVGAVTAEEEAGDGGVWETIIKCSERGVWRGLVLADRTARWCVFAEWVCEG